MWLVWNVPASESPGAELGCRLDPLRPASLFASQLTSRGGRRTTQKYTFPTPTPEAPREALLGFPSPHGQSNWYTSAQAQSDLQEHTRQPQFTPRIYPRSPILCQTRKMRTQPLLSPSQVSLCSFWPCGDRTQSLQSLPLLLPETRCPQCHPGRASYPCPLPSSSPYCLLLPGLPITHTARSEGH